MSSPRAHRRPAGRERRGEWRDQPVVCPPTVGPGAGYGSGAPIHVSWTPLGQAALNYMHDGLTEVAIGSGPLGSTCCSPTPTRRAASGSSTRPVVRSWSAGRSAASAPPPSTGAARALPATPVGRRSAAGLGPAGRARADLGRAAARAIGSRARWRTERGSCRGPRSSVALPSLRKRLALPIRARPSGSPASTTRAGRWPITSSPTTRSNPRASTPVFYAQDYGFDHGFVWYRGHFTATGNETGVR